MASPILPLFSLTLLFTILAAAAVAQPSDAAALQISADTFDSEITFSGEEDFAIEDNRRSLFWKRLIHYYISYGALSANRIPCPPRSGRSYYTHNCYRARGPVHPYIRGCSAITRCRR